MFDAAQDLFHTHFGLAALALIEHDGMKGIQPLLCLPHGAGV